MDAGHRRDWASLLVAVVFSCAVLLLALIAAGLAAESQDFLRHAVSAEGIVTATPHGAAHAQIRFTMKSGAMVQFQQNSMLFGGHHDGDHVTVLFDPENPAGSARVGDFSGLWGTAVSLALMCAGFAAATVVAFIRGLTGRRLVGRS